MASSRIQKLLLALLGTALCLVLAAPSTAKMTTQKISRNVCLTTGGGKFVDIPGFPGERVDRRLLNDIKFLQKRYKIFITDALSEDPVHAANGEHPIGLALDIVPDTSRGGTWDDIDALAAYAEPTQDHPISPFRWVGYNGDAGHGRGNHLHLSYNHSDTAPGVPATSVYTLRCPGSTGTVPPPAGGKNGGGGGNNDGGTDGGSGSKGDGGKGGSGNGGGGSHSGGIGAGNAPPGSGNGGGTGPSGGIGLGRIQSELAFQADNPVIETGGEGFGR